MSDRTTNLLGYECSDCEEEFLKSDYNEDWKALEAAHEHTGNAHDTKSSMTPIKADD